MHFLEQFLPATVVVNEGNQVIHFFGDYQEYLAIAPGKATFNFFSMVNKDISLTSLSKSFSCSSCFIMRIQIGQQYIPKLFFCLSGF